MKKIKLMCAAMAMVVAFSAVPQAAFAQILPTPIEGSETSASAGEVAGQDGNGGSASVEASLSGEVVEISLDEAMEMALENNTDVLAAKNALESAEISKESALRQAKNYSKVLADSNSIVQGLNLQAKMYKLQLEICENAYEAQKSAAKIQVIQGYFGVLCNDKAETAAMYSYTKAENQLKVVESRYNQGMATKLEKLQAETQLNTAKVALDAARATTVQSKRTFNILVGLDTETNWSPTTQLSYQPLLIENVDDKVEEMLAATPTLKIAEASLEVARLTYEDAKAGKANTDAAKLAELTYDDAKNSYENTVNSTRANAKSMLENLSLLYSQYEIYGESQSLLEEVYRLTQLQYDNGLNTQYDVQAAATDIMSNDANRLSALLNYNVVKTMVEQNIISSGN